MKNVIVYTKNGYKIDNGYGKFLFEGKSWENLRNAEMFCEENGIEYYVA